LLLLPPLKALALPLAAISWRLRAGAASTTKTAAHASVTGFFSVLDSSIVAFMETITFRPENDKKDYNE
jgi:hypothetical protein